MEKIELSARELIAAAKIAKQKANEGKTALQCVHIEAKGTELKISATDSYIAVRYTHPIESDAEFSLNVDGAAISKNMKVSDAVFCDGEGIRFGACSLGHVEAKYPALDPILEREPKALGYSAFDPDLMALILNAFKGSESHRNGSNLFGCLSSVDKEGDYLTASVFESDDGCFRALLMPKNCRREIQSFFNKRLAGAARPEAPKDQKKAPKEQTGESTKEQAPEKREAVKAYDVTPKKAAKAGKEPKEKAPKVSGDPAKEPAEETAPEAPKEQKAETPEDMPAKVRALAESNGLELKETSLCLWVSGDTKAHKDELKACGCRWSKKRSAWYYRFDA